MVKAEEYKGIEFVRISKLPADEAEQISDWGKSRRITILTDEEKWRDCLQFADYKQWYEHHYRPSAAMNSVHQERSQVPPKRNFSLGIMRYFNGLLERN